MPLEGIADLPLHSGHVPPWLARIMKRLAYAILYIMVDEFGPDKIVERLSNPLWFQAFNNVIGMDWDSSGSTTVTTGILKEVTWRNPDLGVIVLGGKGRNARRVPEELSLLAKIYDLGEEEITRLKKGSKLVAKIDSAMLQDNYTLYHHTLIVSKNGKWTVVQQGMNTDLRMARRYHWLNPVDYYNNPHEAVSGIKHDVVLNLVDKDSYRVRKIILDLVGSSPDNVVRDYGEAWRRVKGLNNILSYISPTKTSRVSIDPSSKVIVYKALPTPKELLEKLKRLREIYPLNMDELLLTSGVGAKTIRALVLISDLIYNEPPSTRDPVDTPYDPFIYSYAIGGKDGVPYPVRRRDAEKVIETLIDIIQKAKIDRKDKYRALKRLTKIRFRMIAV